MAWSSEKQAAHRVTKKQLARQAALDEIQGKIADGTLVVRQMTPEERERYGPPKNLSTTVRANGYADF